MSTASITSISDAPQGASLKELLSLLKPGVMALVVFTGAVGMLLAPASAHPFIQLLIVLTIAIGSGAGALINMWYDQDIDAIMTRTAKRPLPKGLVNGEDVLTIGIVLSVFSVMVLGLATNWAAAGMLAFAIFFYAVIYTMGLKRSTAQNIVIGGAAGAFPPVIGWIAMTGTFTWEPWALFAIIFFWTPPHFWALALYRNEDYRKADIPMLPVVKGIAHTTIHMEVYCWALLIVGLTPVLMGFSGLFYGVIATALTIRFLLHARTVRLHQRETDAKRMFGFSIIYLFALYSALLIDRAIDSILPFL